MELSSRERYYNFYAVNSYIIYYTQLITMILFGMELLGVAQGCGSGEARVGLCLLRLGFLWETNVLYTKILE